MIAKFEQVQYDCLMSVEAVEFIEIFEALPVEIKIEVTNFARFLFEKSEDNRWEQIITGEKARMKLEEYARNCEEEDSEPLELEKL